MFVLQLFGPAEMRQVEPGFVQVEQSADEKSIIIGEPLHGSRSLPVRAQKDTVRFAVKIAPQEIGRAPRGGQTRLVPQHLG